MATVHPSHTFDGHAGRIFSLAVCCLSDGRNIAATASHDRTVRIWCIDTLEHYKTIQYSDFVWRVFLVGGRNPLVVAFVSAEEKIVVSDMITGEPIRTHFGRLIYCGSMPGFPHPVIINAINTEDASFVDVMTGQVMRVILGGFDKIFRAVPVATGDGHRSLLAFTTWNPQNRRSTIMTYDMTTQEEEEEEEADMQGKMS
mmetsp:Transcript_25622/g.42967  ORF Transcript_25622/g.42967 Transcript_25622/m.42967 type:complete len:200 (-) Transcript_25622:352-951(-)